MAGAQGGRFRFDRSIILLFLVGLTLASTGVWWYATRDDGRPPAHDSIQPVLGTGADEATQPAPAETDVGALEATYQACVQRAGFPVGPVQVVLWDSDPSRPPGGPTPRIGQPWVVKTGPDVPSAIHRPCFVSIGGADPYASSHGH